MDGEAPPKGLTRKVARFWRQVTEKYELTIGQKKLLELAAVELSRAERMDAAIAETGLTITNRFHELRENPLIRQSRLARESGARILSRLGLDLPEDHK